MNVAHILCYNESAFLPFALRHYATFCSRLVCHDLGSTDGSQKLAADAGAELRQHDCRGEFDDRLNKRIKEEEWKTTPCDWAIMADCDELIYFPGGVDATLASYETQRLAVIKPHGYEMLSDTYPTTAGQVYNEVKMGASDFHWYSKPVMFSPKLVDRIEFSTGAHTCKAAMKDRRIVAIGHESPHTVPSTFLLHFHHIGGIERIARLYDENRARQSAINRQMKWGLQEPGAVHAKRKRDLIFPRLERVLP